MRKKLLVTSALIFFVSAGILFYLYSQNQSKTFSVTFLNIGQGDAVLIKFGNGEKMLVDCGPNKIILSELGKNLPFWDRKIDYVLTTHPDLDHYGGCIDVVKRYRVKKIITNGQTKPNDPYWKEWNKISQASGAKLILINGPTVWNIGGSQLTFFSPDDELYLDVKNTDNNNFSIVFKLIAPSGKTFLFTGDMEIPLEQALLEKYCQNSTCPLQANILKIGHHGSDTATGETFLGAVNPDVAVISVGKNKFGHPSLRVIKHLERAGTKIWRTDMIGDIIVK